MRCVKEARKEANQVLFTEKEGNLRAGRRYRPAGAVQYAWLDLLRLQETNQSTIASAKLLGSHD